MTDAVAELADAARLARLVAARVPTVRGRVSVAFAAGANEAEASAGGAPLGERWPSGCLAKLFTATLVRGAAAAGALELDGAVAPLLGASCAALRAVTLRQLLEHTHGLDDSLLAPPRDARGRLDRGELLPRVAALERFASPGAAYSYGHLGAWLAAAALERALDRGFASLLRERLLALLGAEALAANAQAPFCPAGGRGLALTVRELVRFGLLALERDGGLGGAPITPLPGWHPLERGVCLGWKCASAGWVGHQSVWPGASCWLRVHPQRRLALAVAASDEAAALVASRVFGAHVPEVFEPPAMPAAAAPPSALVGVYAQAARVVCVVRRADAWLAHTWQRGADGVRDEPVRASLVPVRGVLLARPAREHLPYVEIVAGENGARWLWNGRCLLRRV
jgi:CubicO group peptidase (beta-lactamase class C family)